MTQYKSTLGSGSTSGSIVNVPSETLKLRYDHSIELAPLWILALRSDLPTVAKNPVSSSNPNGEYEIGIGDADTQAAIIHNLSQRWAIGGGARLIAPTGGDTFGSGKWQVMPVVGARVALWEINSSSYFEPIVRYDVSFAGDPSKRHISNLQLAPMLNIALANNWFLTLYPNPDIRINFGDPITGQTGRLFLPVDFMVGRTLMRDITLSLEVSIPVIKDYPVYDFKAVTRLNIKF